MVVAIPRAAFATTPKKIFINMLTPWVIKIDEEAPTKLQPAKLNSSLTSALSH